METEWIRFQVEWTCLLIGFDLNILWPKISRIFTVSSEFRFIYFLSGSTCSSFEQTRWPIPSSASSSRTNTCYGQSFDVVSVDPKLKITLFNFESFFQCMPHCWKKPVRNWTTVQELLKIREKSDCHCSSMCAAFDFHDHDSTLIQIICDLKMRQCIT